MNFLQQAMARRAQPQAQPTGPTYSSQPAPYLTQQPAPSPQQPRSMLLGPRMRQFSPYASQPQLQGMPQGGGQSGSTNPYGPQYMNNLRAALQNLMYNQAY